jgi:predicted phage tail component-like protein
MADLNITRVGGFAFNSLVIDNDTSEDIILIDVDRDASPNLLYYDFSVPGRNGSSQKDNRYENRVVKIVVGVYAETPQQRRIKERDFLEQIIGKQGRLFFKDMPDLFFFAKAYDKITREEDVIYTKLTISFLSSFCMYEKYDDLRDYTVDELSQFTVDDLEGILVNRQQWDSITGPTIKQISNHGNFETLPIIQIEGTATTLQMQIGNVAFSLFNIANETIYVDSEKMIVYKYVGAEKQSVLTRFMGEFPKIPISTTDVSITGTNLNLNITVDYKNTYIV